MRGDGLHSQRPEHEWEHERGCRVAVVDDDAEPPAANRLGVECRQEITGIALAGLRVVDRPRVGGRCTSQLLPGVVLLDLLLQRRRELDSRLLEEANGDDLLVGRAEADVEAGVVVVLLQQMASHGARQHP